MSNKTNQKELNLDLVDLAYEVQRDRDDEINLQIERAVEDGWLTSSQAYFMTQGEKEDWLAKHLLLEI